MAIVGRNVFKNVFKSVKNRCFASINLRLISSEESFPRKKKEFRRMKSVMYKHNRQDPKLERAARLGNLRVPLDLTRKEWYAKHGAEDTVKLARHYGIYDHVFGGVEFTPSVKLRVSFEGGCEVHSGNVVTPTQASCQPTFDFDYLTENPGFWTILLTNPDGNVFTENMELLHYLTVNVPGKDVSSGDTVCQYLPPVPPMGTGYHRIVCCLMRQTEKIGIENYEKIFSRRLSSRTFSTAQFLSSNDLAPVAMKFFQTSWDESVSQTYTETLGMASPCYESKRFITPTRKRTLSTRGTFENKYRNT